MSLGSGSLDFDAFHRDELPRRISAAAAPLPADYAERLAPLGVRLRESGAAWTYSARDARVVAAPGDSGAANVVELDRESWEGLVQDVESTAGLIYGDRVERVRGDLMGFVAWEPALRWMYQGRPVFEAERIDLRDRDGAPLDPLQGFAPGDDRERMAHFLRTTGYLLVRDVLAPGEIEALRAEAAELERAAIEGDQRSWWGRDASGGSVLCRVLQAGILPGMRALPEDPRIRDLVSLSDWEMKHRDPADVDGVTVLWKRPGVTEGLGDLPWHRDCGMGGHATMCPTLVASIFLEANTPEAGALRFLPGSWKTSLPFAEPGDPDAPEGVVVPARAGDVTLHYGDGLHVAPGPTSSAGPFRSCVLIGHQREGARHHRGERHYNDVLLGSEDGQVRHLTSRAAS